MKDLAPSFRWFPLVWAFHYLGATLCFGALAWMTAVVFTRWKASDLETHGHMRAKALRNAVYYTLSLGMVFALASTFMGDFYVGEMLALAMFAAAWFMKGRFLVGLMDGGRIVSWLDGLNGEAG